jgi:CubicO group peptidase (beta-lactamase class C family)
MALPAMRRRDVRGSIFLAAMLAASVLAPRTTAALVPLPLQPAGVAWPTAEWPAGEPGPDVDPARLAAAVDALFAPRGRDDVPDTRALVVVRGGKIVVERYADGFGPQSRFHSWSMAKTMTQALTGILVARGNLTLDAPAAVPEWQAADDPRHAITLRQLLHMTSGVDNADDTGGEGGDGFAARLLFGPGAVDTTRFGAEAASVHPPDSHWAYSTATTCVVSGIVGRTVGPDREARARFIRTALFEPLGMTSAFIEFDAAGHVLGGSDAWATARDYARFGLLYLRDGQWGETRILPPGWVDFARTPGPAANGQLYGAHVWLNGDGGFVPGGPPSTFQANGNQGQTITMVPTHDLVVVRLGELQTMTWPEMNQRVAALVAVFPPLAGNPQ